AGVCRPAGIIMWRSSHLGPAARGELLLDKDRLHALGLSFEPSWATGNRLRDMQAPPKPPKAAAAAHSSPATGAQSSPDRSAAQSMPDGRAEPGEAAPTANQT